jgi:hypothetical protein
MGIHHILEELIHNTSFRTEAESHELLDHLHGLDDHPEPAEGDRARTAWKPPVPTDAAGNPIIPPTMMTEDQAAKLIALLEASQTPQVPRNVLKGQSDIDFPEDAPTPDVPARPGDAPVATPAADMPTIPAAPVSAADVPPGI